MKSRLSSVWDLIATTFKEFGDDHAAQLAAAIAYYAIFSIPALLIIALGIVGYFYNSNTVQSQLFIQLGAVVGTQTADFVKSLATNSTRAASTFLASLISLIVLLFSASGIFTQIQSALNIIWDVPKKQGGAFKKIVANHFLSFLMVLVIGILFLAYLALSAVIPAIIRSMAVATQNLPVVEAVNLIIQVAILTTLFAMLFRVIPDKEISWSDVRLGAVVTAILFMLGRYAISVYLSLSKSASAYGAAGSLIVLLLWIYYSAQIFLLGAEFTQVYAKKFGSHKTVDARAGVPGIERAPVQAPVKQRG